MSLHHSSDLSKPTKEPTPTEYLLLFKSEQHLVSTLEGTSSSSLGDFCINFPRSPILNLDKCLSVVTLVRISHPIWPSGGRT